jgi:hypothetical protein
MSKVDDYRQRLRGLPDWHDFLIAESHLPGPRGNLELMAAVADEADSDWIYVNSATPATKAPENTPGCFVVCCATQGLGKLAAGGDETAIARLRELASDERWRVRESVAMALQRLGDADFERLLAIAEEWSGGGPLEQRAAAAAICEPRLLKEDRHAGRVMAILDRITKSMETATERRGDAFRALRQGMGYCWSVAIGAYPQAGKPAFEAWLDTKDADVRWVLRENLKKNRLLKLDPGWVEACRARLAG